MINPRSRCHVWIWMSDSWENCRQQYWRTSNFGPYWMGTALVNLNTKTLPCSLEFPALPLEIGASCQVLVTAAVFGWVHRWQPRLRWLISRCTDSGRKRETRAFQHCLSSPLMHPIFQDDSSWEGVHGHLGWKQIPWQVGLMKNLVAFFLLTRCAVCIALKHTHLVTAVNSIYLCADLGIYLSQGIVWVRLCRRVSGLQGVSHASRATSSFRNRWCYVGLYNYKLIIIATMGMKKVQSTHCCLRIQQQEKS